MSTYSFMCQKCGAKFTSVMSIREYCAAPPTFVCCGEPAERFFEVVPGFAIHNALANDRHYEGLRAPDGADISSRAKHQAYMKANNLTTADDFTQTWKRDAEQRHARMAGEDPQRKTDVANAIHKLGG
jgi:hypothetical protein